MIRPTPPDEGKQVGQREAGRSGEFLHGRERAVAWRAKQTARSGGAGEEQNQPGDLAAGGAGEAEEGAECDAAGEEDHRGLGAQLQGRNGESKMEIQLHICLIPAAAALCCYMSLHLSPVPKSVFFPSFHIGCSFSDVSIDVVA